MPQLCGGLVMVGKSVSLKGLRVVGGSVKTSVPPTSAASSPSPSASMPAVLTTGLEGKVVGTAGVVGVVGYVEAAAVHGQLRGVAPGPLSNPPSFLLCGDRGRGMVPYEAVAWGSKAGSPAIWPPGAAE